MSPSRGLRPVIRPSDVSTVCRLCLSRSLTTSRPAYSGHSRWEKIKHDKGKNDMAKNRQRSVLAQEIVTASRLFGPEPNANPRLADLITKAKKEAFPKASIEAAVARGQGRSASGASLENVTVEGILPNNVAIIVDCETDNKLRTLAEVRHAIREHGGSVTPTSYLFTKTGRITFVARDGVGLDELLEPALEAGASDVGEGEDGKMVVFADANLTRSVGEAISHTLDLEIAASEIFWIPNDDTKIGLSDENVIKNLTSFVDDLQEKESTVQTVAMNISNASITLETWKELQSRITV